MHALKAHHLLALPLLISGNLRITRNQYTESDASKGQANIEGPRSAAVAQVNNLI